MTRRDGSKYIGVSRNGGKWQALLLVKDRKRYLGTLENEQETALLYDRFAMLNHGLKKVRKGNGRKHVGSNELLIHKG